MLEEGKTVEMRAIGAGAVNQMIKAFSATRRWFLANKKVNLCLMTDFATQIINEENRTVIVGNIMEYVGGSDE